MNNKVLYLTKYIGAYELHPLNNFSLIRVYPLEESVATWCRVEGQPGKLFFLTNDEYGTEEEARRSLRHKIGV